ncbi:MAG: 3'(2'),5'-bisphosphate nucleotidase CysQ [Cyclobacteriaceae bacterium]|nr:3'(2'),5'-bisphosphate nucleotidase CysQ [Cyclobacteriaceae bacterium]
MYIDHAELTDIAKKAGVAILEIYNSASEFGSVELKSDNSPLTRADKKSNSIITRALTEIYPQIPILSEEGKMTDFSIRKNWDRFWLVDPLDGTKEFLNRNGEFTVNIALIENNFSVFGIIYAPVTGTFYLGDAKKRKALKIHADGREEVLQVNNKTNNRIAVGSRSHSSEAESDLLKTFDVTDVISVGSSLKFCMVAEGMADIYYRHGPTMEWDTAAGQAIVEAAGGKMLKMPERIPFHYKQRDSHQLQLPCIGF